MNRAHFLVAQKCRAARASIQQSMRSLMSCRRSSGHNVMGAGREARLSYSGQDLFRSKPWPGIDPTPGVLTNLRGTG